MSLPIHHAWLWALVACAGGALIEGVLSGTKVKASLSELRLPKASPGLGVWSAIGAGYYVLFFFILRSLLGDPPTPYWTSLALTLAAVLLGANAIWNWIFFRKKDYRLSFVFFLPYLILAAALAAVLRIIGSPLLRWYALYLAYLVYATWWGYRVWRLNRNSSQLQRGDRGTGKLSG